MDQIDNEKNEQSATSYRKHRDDCIPGIDELKGVM
jgi:hypothetical protein